VIISAKHRLLLWAPCLLFAFLVVGTLRRSPFSEWLFTVHKNGMWSSIFIVAAAALISRGEKVAFFMGVLFWILSLASLFFLSRTTLFVLHF
jgi:hypothetical protein